MYNEVDLGSVVCVTPEDAAEPCLGPCRNEQENKTKGPQAPNPHISVDRVYVVLLPLSALA